MSYNRNYNNNFPGGNFTFPFVPDFPPPPLPPPPLPPPLLPLPFVRPQTFPSQVNAQTQENLDRDYIRDFENCMPTPVKVLKPKATTLVEMREIIKSLVVSVRKLEYMVCDLRENIDKHSEKEWTMRMREIERDKQSVNSKVKDATGLYLDMARRVIAKRAAKRLRLKRLREERKLMKKEKGKQLEEKSRKIDENLQKIKDDILKAQQEEQAKLEADVVLREVLRKKHDAKKCIVKLESLMKLRTARQNTARGRGENVSETEATSFLKNIDELKTLWNQKLLIYYDEEAKMRAKLAQHASESNIGANDTETGVAMSLGEWQEALFGDSNANPQEEFHGDLHRFVSVRSQWDQYLDDEGTPLPVGWVVPPPDKHTDNM